LIGGKDKEIGILTELINAYSKNRHKYLINEIVKKAHIIFNNLQNQYNNVPQSDHSHIPLHLMNKFIFNNQIRTYYIPYYKK
jgi:hypothetical protein